MKKWEEQNRARAHQKRIQSAKSTISKNITGGLTVGTAKSPQMGTHHTSSEYSDTYHSPLGSQGSDITRPSSSKLSDYYGFEKTNLTQIPLYKLLRHFGLQQYAKELISRGFGYDLGKLAMLRNEEIDALSRDIKMIPGHKYKLQQIVDHISQICSEIILQEESNYESNSSRKPGTAQTTPGSRRAEPTVTRPSSQVKKPSSALPGSRRPMSSKPSTSEQQKRTRLPEPRQKVIENSNNNVREGGQSIRKLQSIGLDYFSDSQSIDEEFSQDISALLKLYEEGQPLDSKKPVSSVSQPQTVTKTKEKVTFKEPQADLMGQVNKLYNKDIKTNQNNPTQATKVQTTVKQTQPQKSTAPATMTTTNATTNTVENKSKERPKSGVAQNRMKPQEKVTMTTAKEKESDKQLYKRDIGKVKESTKPESIEENPAAKAKVMDLLEKKLDPNHLNKDELNLELKKIKDMYSSFEGATMTATIANIDLEEICHCFSCAIEKHVEYFVQNILPSYTPYEFSKPAESNTSAKPKPMVQKEEKPVEMGSPMKVKAPTGGNSGNSGFKLQANPISVKSDYEQNTDFFVYKGKTVPKGDLDEEEEEEDVYRRKNHERHLKEEDDEVVLSESQTFGEEEEEKKEDSELERKAEQEHDEYNEKNFQDFLKQSLKDSVFFSMVGSRGQQDDTDALMNRLKASKPQFQSNQRIEENSERSQTELSYTREDYSEDREEDSREVDEEEEEDDEYDRDIRESRTSFSIEESQFIDIEMTKEEMDAANRTKYIFEKTFNDKNLSPEECMKRLRDVVSRSDVSNFCKNLMITSKMEKEVIIVSLVYVERLMVYTNMYLNSVNWKRICFTAFVIASKIWDDESFENQHFAKVFPQYTIKEINELERVFLECINYNLRVNGTDYAKYYFILRTFADKNKKSFSLKALNVQTVRMLQKKVEDKAISLKQVFAEGLNRSFA